MKLVKTARARSKEDKPEEERGLNEGMTVLKELVCPWAKTDRVVAGDSHFASVQAACELCKIGLRCTGVVKTATRDHPHNHLSKVEFKERGECCGLVHDGSTAKDPDLLAFAWVDRDRRHFTSTCSSLRMVDPIVRCRMRQVNQEENAEPEMVRLQMPQPLCSSVCCDNCGRVDQHNRVRQDGLKLETKFGTHDWSQRHNLSFLSVCVVDAFNVFKGCRETDETFNEHTCKLADEMIEFGLTARCQRASAGFGFGVAAETPTDKRASAVARLTPTKKMRTPDDKDCNAKKQTWCSVCKNHKTIWLCSHCSEVAVCHLEQRGSCFDTHCGKVHGGLLCQAALIC